MFYPASDLACGFAALLTICLLGGFAAAQGMGGAMADKVQIELRGHIVPRCDLTGAASTLDLGTIAETGAQGEEQLQFELSCNAPFAYQLSSEHGAMRHESASSGAGAFSTEFPYRAALKILTDSGSTLSLDCASSELGETSGPCAGESGEDTAIGKDATLAVSWGPLDGPLTAGRYTDDLHISIGIEN
jgi:hypothetical protein